MTIFKFDAAYVKKFRGTDATYCAKTKAFRSFSHGWEGDNGVLHAVQRLLNGEEVRIAIAAHPICGDEVYTFVTAKIEGRKLNISDDVNECLSLDSNFMALDLGVKLAYRVAGLVAEQQDSACSFLQPTPEELEQINNLSDE